MSSAHAARSPRAPELPAGTAPAPPARLRVALLSPCFWPEVRRGGERLVHELATGLIARGHRPRLITSHPGRPRRTVEDGLPIVRHWRPPAGRLRHRGWEDHLTHVPFSYLSLARGEDDLAQAFFPTDALAAARWSSRTGLPSIFSYLGMPDGAYLSGRRLRMRITLRAARGCDAMTVVSAAAAAAVRRWLGAEARVIHPGVDLELFRPAGERAAEATIFCAAAIEDPMKRVGLLTEAFTLLRRRRRDARLLLERPHDAALAARLEGVAGVELVDVPDDPSALPRLYSEAWISVLPSRAEAFGTVLAESLACGTPVVGTDHGGIPELIDRPDIGRLFAPDDERALARSLDEALELASHPGAAAACRARAGDFSRERCVEAHEALYRELIAARARRRPRR